MAAGPKPAETLDRIIGLVEASSNTVLQAGREPREPAPAAVSGGADVASNPVLLAPRTVAIRGNADRELLGDEVAGLLDDWVRARLTHRHREFIASLPETVELDVSGVGRVLFCHGSPRSDDELILRTTPDEWVREMLAGVEADVVVCGHTHMQFDRVVDGIRVVNAGSVGLPYGAPGAHWLMVGPRVEHRRTPYDADAFAAEVAASDWPKAERFAEENIRNVPSEKEALGFFEQMAAEQWAARSAGR